MDGNVSANGPLLKSQPFPVCATILFARLSKTGGGEGSAEESVMGELFQPTHLLVIGLIVFVLFGAKRLPELGKGLGEGLKGFKDGIKTGGSEPVAQQQSAAPVQPKAEAIEPK
jgi:sec-independent protein translocase protein TatA